MTQKSLPYFAIYLTTVANCEFPTFLPCCSFNIFAIHFFFISANGTKWVGRGYEIGRSLRRCVSPSVCLSVYTNWGHMHFNERFLVCFCCHTVLGYIILCILINIVDWLIDLVTLVLTLALALAMALAVWTWQKIKKKCWRTGLLALIYKIYLLLALKVLAL